MTAEEVSIVPTAVEDVKESLSTKIGFDLWFVKRRSPIGLISSYLVPKFSTFTFVLLHCIYHTNNTLHSNCFCDP